MFTGRLPVRLCRRLLALSAVACRLAFEPVTRDRHTYMNVSHTGVVLDQQLLVEAPPTHGALVEFLARVNGHVLGQVNVLFEALPTH